MVRRMADARFRERQERGRYAAHVRPINELVDRLIDQDGRGWLPYVAPWHGGVRARLLSVLRDPGPMTRQGSGSGFLCLENDDPTAAFQAEAFAAAGIAPRDMTAWNAYPWYINRAPTGAELDAGVAPLAEMVRLLPRLRVVLLQGGHAQASWRRLVRRHPAIADRDLLIVATYHPSPQALRTPDPALRQARIAHRLHAYQAVAAGLRSPLAR